ncbi:hypothetical protein Gotur_015671 [Gossypium turneri]
MDRYNLFVRSCESRAGKNARVNLYEEEEEWPIEKETRIQGENNKNKRPVTSYPPKPPLPKGLKLHIVENMGGSNCILVILKNCFSPM